MPRILPLACLTFLLAACSGPSDTGPAAKGPPPVTVSLTTAASTPVETRVRALAMVEATHAPQVVAEVTGRVTEVLADVGDTVKAGQPLVRLDPAMTHWLSIIGAAYIVWLAWRIAMSTPGGGNARQVPVSFWAGCGLQFVNVKIILYVPHCQQKP